MQSTCVAMEMPKMWETTDSSTRPAVDMSHMCFSYMLPLAIAARGSSPITKLMWQYAAKRELEVDEHQKNGRTGIFYQWMAISRRFSIICENRQYYHSSLWGVDKNTQALLNCLIHTTVACKQNGYATSSIIPSAICTRGTKHDSPHNMHWITGKHQTTLFS